MTTTENDTGKRGDVDREKDPTGSLVCKSAVAAKFHHPYTPYDVQMQFMRTVYDVCERGGGQVGILESPTGTGKSLSLICGALTWLRQWKKQQAEGAVATPQNLSDEPDWVVEQMLRKRRDELRQKWERREARLAAARLREARQQAEERTDGGARKRRRVEGGRARAKKQEDEEEAEFLPGEGDRSGMAGAANDDDRLSWLSAETRAMMEKAGLVGKKEDDEAEDDEEEEVKIYYTSRTHSQLTQFIAELRRPSFPSCLPEFGDTVKTEKPTAEPVRHIPLSSRQRLCINPAVSRLGSVGAINDRCAELQKAKPKKDKGKDGGTSRCPFALSDENRAAERQFRDAALATLPDIEDLYRLGTSLHVCPYYASRTAAAAGAEIVTLPYPLLLQKEAREALGIQLANSIVIVDEAHNIMDAVASVHAAAIRLSELRRARQLLEVYVRRFGRRLRGEGRVMVGQLARVIQGLTVWMAGVQESSQGQGQGIVDPSALLRHRGADQINLFELVQYVRTSKLAYKVESYGEYVQDQDQDQDQNQNRNQSQDGSHDNRPVLHTLVSFLRALTNLSSEGRIFYEALAATGSGDKKTGPSPPDVQLSYLLLSPTHAFSSIAADARAVILAGGTMAPFSDYRTHLFPNHVEERITTLSCGHVIPAENLCVWTLASTSSAASASSSPLDFSFQKRSTPATMRDLGASLLNLSAVVPDGVVVFFPSYGYLDEVVAAWQQRPAGVGGGGGGGGGSVSLWERLASRKAIFRETRGGSSDDVLAAYSEAILGTESRDGAPTRTTTGALLLSVVGGKMSEGINFADRLGRCVVVVGLPFANPHAPDWKARMQYMEAHGGAAAARAFYENACMRAVNQSIGRAIRHRGDYAAIVLADRRFATARIREKLPAWIRAGVVAGSEDRGLSGMVSTLGSFFRGKKGHGMNG